MTPAVPQPEGTVIRIPVELKLKPQWRYDPARRVFVSQSGAVFSTRGQLPKGTKIVYKVPSLVEADESKLSRHEKELRRYMQVILPKGESPANYVDVVRAWPSVAEVSLGPEISLP